MELVSKQRNRIHPHKFIMWIAIGSIVMMFAGLTSAYIVKHEQPSWTSFRMPKIFWFSTLTILAASLTMQMALKAFKARERGKYTNLLLLTVVLGFLFVVLQWFGFLAIWKQGITFQGSGAGQFLYVIAGLHAIHVIGGITALVVVFIRTLSKLVRHYNPVPVEIVATYWHFVDLLWIYLFIFFLLIQ